MPWDAGGMDRGDGGVGGGRCLGKVEGGKGKEVMDWGWIWGWVGMVAPQTETYSVLTSHANQIERHTQPKLTKSNRLAYLPSRNKTTPPSATTDPRLSSPWSSSCELLAQEAIVG